MKTFREVLGGLMMAVLIALIVVGSLALSLAEGLSTPNLPPQPTETPFDFPNSFPIQATKTKSLISPTATATISCIRPTGWEDYLVQMGDTLESLTLSSGQTASRLREANCLRSDDLVPGTILFLPPLTPTSTSTPQNTIAPSKCGPPAGWIAYRVKSQDTLFRLSLNYGVSVPQLQYANCMGSSTFLRVGDIIYVPNVATRTPEITSTQTGTNEPTQTSTVETETVTPVPSETPTSDATPTTGVTPAT